MSTPTLILPGSEGPCSTHLKDGEDHVNEDDEQQRQQKDGVAEGARDRRDSLEGRAGGEEGGSYSCCAPWVRRENAKHVCSVRWGRVRDDANQV